MRMTLVRAWATAAAVVALLTVALAPSPASAQPAQSARPAVAGESMADVRTLHFIRVNCDDEAAIFSDDVGIYVNGNWIGSWSNVDGGDWRDIGRDFAFEGEITISAKEWAGWTIGTTTISADEAFTGEQVRHWFGHHTTAYHYRITYWVD